MMKGSGNVWMEDMQAKTEDGGELSRQGEGRSPLHKKKGLGNHEVGILYEPPLKSQLSQVTGSRLCPNRQPVTRDFLSLPGLPIPTEEDQVAALLSLPSC